MSGASAIETIRELNEVFERYDFVAVRDALEASPPDDPTSGVPELDELFRERIADGFVMEFDGGAPLEANRHEGLNDWMSVWRRWLSAFDEYSLEVAEYEVIGDEVVIVDVVHRGRGRASGLEIELPQTQVWRTRHGLLLYCGVFEARERALERAAAVAGI